jgi:adenylate cyclase
MTDTSLDQHAALASQVGLLALLEDGLDALELGVGLFDGNLRLVDCNRLFRKIRGYPASLCQSGTPLIELLRHDLLCGQLDESGHKDPVQSWLNMAAKQQRHAAETKLDDGRVVAMALTPIGDQGVVLTVSDISHRVQATESLRAKQEWLDLVTEASSEGIYDWDISTGDLRVSYRLTAMLGLSPGGLNASSWNEHIHPDDFAAYRAALTKHFRGESQYLKCEYRVRRRTGDYIWFADSGKCVRDASGRARRLVGAVSDVTARKMAEASLAQSEERYALAMQAINEGVYDWNIEANTIFYSEGVRAALGLEPDQLKTPEDWVNRIHDEDKASYRAALVAHFRGQTPRFELEFRYRGSSGDWRWARQYGIARFNERGRAVRMIGATGDVTNLKRAEIALRESDERYALATEAATEGLYDWNVIADRLVVSERLNAIMQLQSGALSSMEWNERVYPADRAKYRAAMLAHFRGETRYISCEYRARTGTGEFIWLADNATSVRNAEGRVTRLVGAIANINARKQAEDELREARQRAENASLLAMEKAQMLESLSTKLSKYLSPQVYSSIFSGQQNVAIEAKRKKLTIFFSDIVGFTSIADMLESEELTALLNDYLTEMSRIALEHGATIDKFIGDAILAFFGDPESKGPKEDAIACVRMAIAMQRRMREMQADWRGRGLDRAFELRMGITTGFCTVGNFGSEDRMDYTVVGNEVNRAARLQSHAETGGILLASETYALVKDVIAASEEGQIALKGIPRPVHAYKVLGIYSDLVATDRIIALDQPGMRLLVNPDELTPENRNVALKALEEAVVRLKQKLE